VSYERKKGLFFYETQCISEVRSVGPTRVNGLGLGLRYYGKPDKRINKLIR